MLNDVHPPPLEPRDNAKPVRREIRGRHPKRADRAHSLEKTSDHGMGTNIVYDEPEDRGGSFNTRMSAIIVGVVVIVIAYLAWSMWK